MKTSLRALAQAAGAPTIAIASWFVLSGCEIIASPDRSKIPEGDPYRPEMPIDDTRNPDAAGPPAPDASGSTTPVDAGGPADASGASPVDGSAVPADAAGTGADAGAVAPPAKIIYLHAMPKKANFGGIAGADALCGTNPPVAGTYKALIADGKTRGVGMNWVLAPNTTYVRADGTTVIGTTKADATFAFPLKASIGTSAVSYWTGLENDWSASPDDCNDWSGTAGFSATAGLGDATDYQSIKGVLENCATLAGAFIACVQQ